MLRGIYSAAYAMDMAARNQEIISDNLVHVTTPGYRRQGLLFEAAASSVMPAPGEAVAASAATGQPPSSYVRQEQGTLQQTNNPFDMAISGTPFFVVEGPNGPLYTRNGGFELGPGGTLQTRGGGYRVSGQGGALTIPPEATTISVASDGTITANGAEVGRLQLADFERPETLRRVGATLFEGDAPQAPPPHTVRIDQGYREGSNVQAVQEMVSMMIGLRHYEAAGKVLQAVTDAIAQNTRPKQA
jgi:flagellar basal body rod protein FlgG